jgi:hypothetical protein
MLRESRHVKSDLAIHSRPRRARGTDLLSGGRVEVEEISNIEYLAVKLRYCRKQMKSAPAIQVPPPIHNVPVPACPLTFRSIKRTSLLASRALPPLSPPLLPNVSAIHLTKCTPSPFRNSRLHPPPPRDRRCEAKTSALRNRSEVSR